MILLPHYDQAPIRVVRKSHPNELGHQRYFDRLGYLYVYSGHVDSTAEVDSTPEDRRRAFLAAATEHSRADATSSSARKERRYPPSAHRWRFAPGRSASRASPNPSP